jgi:beta-glucosidase
MIPHRFEKFLEDIMFLVETGEIPMSRIDDAVERILRVKFISGVFEHPFSDQTLLDVVGCKVSFFFLYHTYVYLSFSLIQNLIFPTIYHMLTVQEHRLLAREAVRKSLVLLKNGKDQKAPFLPLAKNAKRILVAGTHADDIGYQCGGWTIAWHGDSGKITLGEIRLCFARTKKITSFFVLHTFFILYYQLII